MITLLILAIIAVILVAIAVCVLVVGGVAGVVIFGDLIVCVAVIIFIMKKIKKR